MGLISPHLEKEEDGWRTDRWMEDRQTGSLESGSVPRGRDACSPLPTALAFGPVRNRTALELFSDLTRGTSIREPWQARQTELRLHKPSLTCSHCCQKGPSLFPARVFLPALSLVSHVTFGKSLKLSRRPPHYEMVQGTASTQGPPHPHWGHICTWRGSHLAEDLP